MTSAHRAAIPAGAGVSMIALLLAAATIVWLGCVLLLFRRLRKKALAIERGGMSVAEKVHRLQRLVLLAVVPHVVLLFVVVIGAGVAVGLTDEHANRHHGALAGAVGAAAGVVMMLVAMAAVTRAVRPSLARVRDVPYKVAHRARAGLVGGLFALVLLGLMALGRAVIPAQGTAHLIGLVVVYVVVLVGVQSLLAPLIVIAFRSRPLPDETRARLLRLAADIGVRVRDIRVFEGRQQKVANAAQVGSLPGLRYILVTDYLLDSLPADEVDAVVAHELGHARGHHVLIKMLTIVGVLAVLQAILLVLHTATGTPVVAVIFVPLVFAFPVGLLLVQGLVGVRLEERADDIAARATGAENLAAALDRVGALNDTKRDTGRIWSLLTQHPGLDARLARLRESPRGRSAVDSPT